MPEPLFHPDNRMLSGFTHDFSLFGGQPDPAVTIGPQQTQPADTDGAASRPAAEPETAPASPLTTQDAGADRHVAEDATVTASLSAGQYHMSEQASVAADASTSAQPAGSSTPPDVLASLTPHPASPASSLEDHGSAAPSDGQTALVGDQIGEGIIPVLGSLTSGGVALAGFTTAHLAQSVAAGVHTVGQIGGAVVGDATDGLHDTVSTVGAVVDDAVTPATDGLGDLAGSDPIGGITTLVGMVNTVDQFAVSSAAPAHAVESTGSIVDDLIGGNEGSGLLGDADHGLDPAHLAHHDTGIDHVLGGL